MPKTRTLIHVHCKATNEDWYYLYYVGMKKDEHCWPISAKRIKILLYTVDYFERKGFYFRKSNLARKACKTTLT